MSLLPLPEFGLLRASVWLLEPVCNWLGISATIFTLIGLEALSYLFKSIGMKSSMVEFSTDNKETLNRMAKKFNSKEYNIVSYQLDEKKRLGEVTTYYVTNGYKIQEIQ